MPLSGGGVSVERWRCWDAAMAEVLRDCMSNRRPAFTKSSTEVTGEAFAAMGDVASMIPEVVGADEGAM